MSKVLSAHKSDKSELEQVQLFYESVRDERQPRRHRSKKNR